MTLSVIVVAGIYEGSGMATWCIEAAEALAVRGEPVCLCCLEDISLPPLSDGIHVVRIPRRFTSHTPAAGRIRRELARIAVSPRPFLRQVCAELASRQMTASAFLLNAPFFLDTGIPVPQYVVAWGYPSSFYGYMQKVPMYIPRTFSIEAIRILLDNIGVYRSDWHGFRHATGVMSVSKKLHDDLRRRRVRSSMVHPGLGDAAWTKRPNVTRPRIVMMAVDLDVPRKRVPWMLSALKDLPVSAELTLIGKASERTRALAEATGMAVTLTGRLPRHEALDVLGQGTLFLFGSIIEDWGYVLVEAMARGLAVVAPDQSPFDEMVGPLGSLFTPQSSTSFRDAAIAELTRPAIPAAVRAEWLVRFSRDTFGRALRDMMHRHGPSSH